ncbi:Long-chain fatty acid transport protein [Roseivivax lentus]|uniref:Long-chain fatty acid transport protein n=1 Tax=Roseivivax lentus TaxID=633194 RepID=A0A1N7MQG5_9RHOB|nr:outer membrane protein transport protein [Roseivivax lentus]SIS88258.1 Long-chain fatty acid transport protein [Roseivivax lentus]
MKYAVLGASALALTAASAQAGGIDRTGQSIDMIFKPGTYAELSFGSARPEVSGSELAGLGQGDASSGDMTKGYLTLGLALKHDYNEKLSVGIIYDQPFGADVDYPTGTGYYAEGSNAEFNSEAFTLLGRYKLSERFSVHGGVRYQVVSAKAEVDNFINTLQAIDYEGQLEQASGFGYVVGAAYEIPDIALRVALTYNSEITTKHDTTEVNNGAIGNTPSTESDIEITTPQSVNLAFQTGVAADTLLFGGVRWVNWSEFDITPDVYEAVTGGPLVAYENDTYTYSLGVGRRFSPEWAGSVSIGYEEQNGDIVSNLGPTDGFWSLGLGAAYTFENVEVSMGARYVWIGDAETRNAVAEPAGSFEDNTALGVGMKIGVTF